MGSRYYSTGDSGEGSKGIGERRKEREKRAEWGGREEGERRGKGRRAEEGEGRGQRGREGVGPAQSWLGQCFGTP